MKRLFAMLTLASTLAIPVNAQEFADTVGGAEERAMEFRAETPDDDIVASIAPGFAMEGIDMAIGVSSASGPAKLSLTDDQLEKIAKIKADASDAAAGKKAQLHTLHRQLKDSLIKENVDKSSVMDLQSKINSLMADLSNSRLSARLETLAVFTPEQKQKLRHAALQRQVLGGKKGFGKHHGRGGHHGKGGFAPGGGHGGRRGPGGCSVPGAGADKADASDASIPPA